MICLNKADEGTFRHLTFNQSPPALAANATTRQDLNGISNLREYVASGQDDSSGGSSGGMLGQTALDEKLGPELDPVGDTVVAPDAGRLPRGLSLRFKVVAGGEDQRRLVWVPSSRCLERLWSWTTWTLSVLFFSYMFSNLRTSSHWTIGNENASSVSGSASNSSVPAACEPTRVTLAQPPLHHLSKRSTCASGGVDKDEYNTGLHTAALFIIWFVSTMGCAFPIMAAKFPGLRIPRRFFFVVRHFGTGVLIATAFVHLLPTAFVSLGNPCLGDFWTKKYEAMPGAIVLAAIFLVVIIEMVFHPSRHISPAEIVARSASNQIKGEEATDSDGQPIRDMGPLRGRSSSMAQGLSQLNQAASRDGISNQEDLEESAIAKKDTVEECRESLDHGFLTPEQKRNKERLQCILLEMGILFHSVFIGMALSVSIGSDFIVLLIAIVFHRKSRPGHAPFPVNRKQLTLAWPHIETFEGLALGSRISVIEWGSKSWQPWLMALAYGCTTPIGQAIGLATHTLYSPDSEVGLILVGVMNAISAGLLTFASLVELLSEDFLSDESWRYLRGKSRVVACVLVFFGAFFMSLVGAWA
ncbi:hypothetical protein QQS21_006046 [Conoideocrella luteorostrata]|uniref:Zinc/iron permease n=1 Tax=Conoideocrella luteorostrata TaxID=1105319 RepID=A0AAJ0CQR4_9HYPO|nr:hypothetical protein QQS21_006046 [Conoideocrella luteorostrata]